MPTREEAELKERADRALRTARPGEALSLYRSLLRRVTVFEAGLYEGWLEGALSAYQAPGRSARRATCCWPCAGSPTPSAPSTRPRRWNGRWPRPGGASGARRPRCWPAQASPPWPRWSWTRPTIPRGPGAVGTAAARRAAARPPYETALVHFNWAEALRRLGDRAAARRAWARTQELLEELADEFERRGQRERAFDCYGMLLRLGRDSGSFENVAEGYLNAIRLLAGDDQKFYVLQYYEDFLAYAVQSREWQAAATLAREAADIA